MQRPQLKAVRCSAPSRTRAACGQNGGTVGEVLLKPRDYQPDGIPHLGEQRPQTCGLPSEHVPRGQASFTANSRAKVKRRARHTQKTGYLLFGSTHQGCSNKQDKHLSRLGSVDGLGRVVKGNLQAIECTEQRAAYGATDGICHLSPVKLTVSQGNPEDVALNEGPRS